MYEFSQDFLNGDVAIIVPEHLFDGFIASCVEAEIHNADDLSNYSWAKYCWRTGYEIFCHVPNGEYLNIWRNTTSTREIFAGEYDDRLIMTWPEAIASDHIILATRRETSDILDLL